MIMKRLITSFLKKARYVRLHATNSKQETKPLTHVPVLSKEVISLLKVEDGNIVVDMTFGAGGHSAAMLNGRKNVKLFAVDCDPLAIEFAKRLKASQILNEVVPIHGKFSNIRQLLKLSDGSVDAILIDCGTSSMQFDDPQRGFSLSSNSFLDMRMHGSPQNTALSNADGFKTKDDHSMSVGEDDKPRNAPSRSIRDKRGRNSDLSAYDAVNFLSARSLRDIFMKYGEERHAKLIAEAIVEARHELGAIRTTHELAEIVALAIGRSAVQRFDKVGRSQHVATRVFQALRIFVNDELNELANGLDAAHALLKPGGRCAVITFHSLEDRIVKRRFTNKLDEDVLSGERHKLDVQLDDDSMKRALAKRWHPIVDGVLEAHDDEVRVNPRARSAKLRVAIKTSESLSNL